MTAEQDRLYTDGTAWKLWGPYLAERAWAQLAPTLDGLVASRMLERVPAGAQASNGVSP